MLPQDLDDWITDEGLRVAEKAAASGPESLTEWERLLNEVSLFDTEQQNGGVSQYFCNWGLERWRLLSRLAGPVLRTFDRMASNVNAVVANAADPYLAVIESDTDLDAWYEEHQTQLVSELRTLLDAGGPAR